jgi:hypothetical protein
LGKPHESNSETHQEIKSSASDHLRRPPRTNPCKVFYYFCSFTKKLNLPVNNTSNILNLQQNGSDFSLESDSDSKYSSESEGSGTSNCDEDTNVCQEEAIHGQSQSCTSNSSGNDDLETDRKLEGRNNGGNWGGVVGMRNSEDIATIVDREPISIDSVSVH